MLDLDLHTLQALIAQAPGCVVWTDDEGQSRWVSRPEAGFPIDALLDHERGAAAGGFEPGTHERWHTGPDGRLRRYLTKTTEAWLDGGARGHLHLISEITGFDQEPESETARQRADEELRAQVRRTAQILETMHDGYLLVGEQGRILDVNAAYAQLVGRERESLLGTPLGALALDDDSLSNLNDLLESNDANFETRHRHVAGHTIDLDVSASTMIVDGRRLATLFLRDITARKRAERERRELEALVRHKHKLEAIGTLASGVAHEINNPIQGILGFAQLIQSRHAAGTTTHDFAGEIIVECGRVARIVSNLLAFARRDSEAQTPSDVGHLVLTTLALLRPALVRDNIVVEVELPSDLPTIACRGDQIRQVVMNLLTNARDALNKRFVDTHPDKQLVIRACTIGDEAEPWVRIEVEDRGSGVAPEIAERIFDPFFTTKDPDAGTGLGLAVSHRIVADHGGRLEVDSAPGDLTRFRLELPVEAEYSPARRDRTGS